MKRIVILSLLSALLSGCVVYGDGYRDGYNRDGYYRHDYSSRGYYGGGYNGNYGGYRGGAWDHGQ